MQLKRRRSKAKKRKPIKAALAAATCVLLGVAAPAMSQDSSWDFDSAVLYYSEKDGINVVEPVFSARRDFGDERSLDLKLAVDTITGATPNGATATDGVQTFTSPSGRSSYTSQSGDTPVDDEFFKDTRTALNVQWEQPLGRLTKGSFGAYFSDEYDFESTSVNAAISRDFNKRNTTLTFGLSFESDTIDPVGGVPIPFASMGVPGGPQPRQGSDESKDVTDLLFGVTQVINRRMLMQFNYSYSDSSGYSTDPYKLISVVNGVTGDTVDYVFENRPDSRVKQSLFWKTKYHLERDVLDISYRFLSDDWGIDSHTLDFRYRWQLRKKHYLEPHVRFYTQSEADFYTFSLVNGAPLPEFASADYRLGEFDAWTVGFKFGRELSKNREYSFRLEYYRQAGDSSPSDAVGSQRNQDLFPTVEAIIGQFSYAFFF